MERYIVAQAERLEQLSAIVAGLTTQAGAWEGVMRHSIQHVGLVRFNPFEDTGGNQSFALALLDADADGIVLLLVAFWLARRVRAVDSRLQGLTRGADGDSLEAVLDAHLDKVFAVAREVDDLADRTVALEVAARRAFSRVGLVRYNPFEETGGNQSFALALLDADGDGWVLSSLHARSGTRVYAKAIAGGRAETALSEEETAALRQATA